MGIVRGDRIALPALNFQSSQLPDAIGKVSISLDRSWRGKPVRRK
jgi:hypothetical protein